jgi:hypothetical protein
MEKIIVFAIIITLLFFVLKYVEGQYLDTEKRPLKYLLRDATIVFVSSLAVLFLTTHFDSHVNDFLAIITGVKNAIPEKAQIFTGEPEF